MKAILIDDDKKNSDFLESLLNTYCPEVNIISKVETVNEALASIALLKPDLLFLDIELHDKNATDILSIIPASQELQTILITAHAKYAIPMYKYSISGYLLKPVEISELIEAVNKALMVFRKSKQLHDLLKPAETEKYIVLPDHGNLNIQNVDEIVYLESESNYTIINTRDGKHITTSKTLKVYEDLLPSKNFLRVHNSFIVNLHFVDGMLRSKNGSLLLKNGIEIPISASRKKEVHDRIVR